MEFNKLFVLFVLLFVSFTTLALGQGTSVDFYKKTCPKVRYIVRDTVEAAVKANPTMAPGILRMFFHDCYIRGCDASLLLNGSTTEKSAPPNSLLRGFEVIDAAKTKLEAACPGVVSCADILALAARDTVILTGGRSWEVPLGRRDGLISLANDTLDLPAFNDPITVQIQKFAKIGLTAEDMVTLVGSHTIGTAACFTFSYRLYNFSGTGRPDPDINPAFLPQLRQLCPNGGNPLVRGPLDTGSVNSFGNSFYNNLKNGRGVIESDAKLWSDPRTRVFVQKFLKTKEQSGTKFRAEFGKAMVKMGNNNVKTGKQGEIRKVCGATN